MSGDQLRLADQRAESEPTPWSTSLRTGETDGLVPLSLGRGGETTNEERRQAGTPATLEENIEKSIDKTDDTGGRQRAQHYPVRYLEQRYGLSRNYATVLVAEFGWGTP